MEAHVNSWYDGSPWSPALENLLREYWNRGTTAKEISRLLTEKSGRAITRNAVCGKSRRLKLKPRPSPIRAKVA